MYIQRTQKKTYIQYKFFLKITEFSKIFIYFVYRLSGGLSRHPVVLFLVDMSYLGRGHPLSLVHLYALSYSISASLQPTPDLVFIGGSPVD